MNMESMGKRNPAKKKFKNPPTAQMTYLLVSAAFQSLFLGITGSNSLQNGSKKPVMGFK